MAPLPPESTARYYADYSTVGKNHTLVVRATAALSPASFGTLIDSFWTALGSLVFTTTLNTVRFSASGSNVSNPVTCGFEGTVYGAAAGTVDSAPVALNFIGRSTSGRRVRGMVFSYSGAFSTYRLTSAEDAAIANTVAVMNGATNAFLAIDGTSPIWYPYANVLVNAYWQRAVRA